jgi:hypothetical protein
LQQEAYGGRSLEHHRLARRNPELCTGEDDGMLVHQTWPRFRNVLKGKAQVVYGSRFTGERRNLMFWHWVGNRFLSLVTNILYNTTLSDMETGYKAFTIDVLRAIEPLYESDFRIEPELTAKICRGRYRIYEVPIAYYGRSYAEGKKIKWHHTGRVVWNLIKYRFVT